MKIKASNMPFWVSRYSGLLPLDALAAIDKHLTESGKRVWVDEVTYERIA